jgi:hypothetical protein
VLREDFDRSAATSVPSSIEGLARPADAPFSRDAATLRDAALEDAFL